VQRFASIQLISKITSPLWFQWRRFWFNLHGFIDKPLDVHFSITFLNISFLWFLFYFHGQLSLLMKSYYSIVHTYYKCISKMLLKLTIKVMNKYYKLKVFRSTFVNRIWWYYFAIINFYSASTNISRALDIITDVGSLIGWIWGGGSRAAVARGKGSNQSAANQYARHVRLMPPLFHHIHLIATPSACARNR